MIGASTRPGQTTLSVPLEVKPESYARLCAMVDALHDRGNLSAGEFAPFMGRIGTVHFLSMSVFPGTDFDPLFVIEANVDGDPAAFWQALQGEIGAELTAMVRCCKRPSDRDGALYDAVTAEKGYSAADYLHTRARRPSVFHHGNRGLARSRILQERELFAAARAALDAPAGPSPYRGTGAAPEHVHAMLRSALLDRFPWLDEAAAARIPKCERAADILRLLAFVAGVAVVLALPGTMLALVMPTVRFLVLAAVLMVGLGLWVAAMRKPLPGTATPRNRLRAGTLLKIALAAVIGMIAGTIVVVPLTMLALIVLSGFSVVDAWQLARHAGVLGMASALLVVVPGIVAWLRWLERRDAAHDAPPIDAEAMRGMAQREDWIPQSHMASVVLLKPGILRSIIVRAGHLGLGLVLRVKAADGYLGSMRTVHFAHWAFVNNGARLTFFSNFDQSWESYLDDFIEKAHVGLTLAWGCGVGFPVTRFLVFDGASHGRQFKAWARYSMAISRFWYSAYPDLTVDQVERNNRIANGLRRPTLSAEEAATWIRDL